MAKISVRNFISELDAFFAKEDLQGARRCMLEWRKRAAESGDKSGELTVLNEMTGFYRQTKEETEGMAAIRDAFALIDEPGIKNSPSAATIYLNGAITMKSFGKSDFLEPHAYEIQNKIRNPEIRLLHIMEGGAP